jgi:F-type H+-transporting ATPase subunit a
MEISTFYNTKIYKTDASGALTEEHGHPNVRPLDLSITKSVIGILGIMHYLMFCLQV